MDWQKKYRDKIMSPAEAVRLIRSGDTVTSNFGGSIPYALLDALADYATDNLEDVTLYLAGFYKEARIVERPYNGHVRIKSCFLGPGERRAITAGSNLSYQPMHLSNITQDRTEKHRARVMLAAGARLSLGNVHRPPHEAHAGGRHHKLPQELLPRQDGVYQRPRQPRALRLHGS